MTGIDPGWLWLIGGVVLLILEVIAPGFAEVDRDFGDATAHELGRVRPGDGRKGVGERGALVRPELQDQRTRIADLAQSAHQFQILFPGW